MALPRVPIDMKTLAKVGQMFESESHADAVIEVMVDASASRALIARCRKVLEVRPGTVELVVSSFDGEMPSINKNASLILVIAGTSPHLRRISEITLWSEMNCAVLTENAAALVATVPEEDALEIARTIIEVDVNKPQEVLEHDLAKWCIVHVPELRLTLGAAFPYMRRAIAADFTRHTSLENAIIAAVFFLPGPDLPILTLNQCKLLYQIAVINEVSLSRERLVDVAFVIASAFGLRGLSHLALKKLVPVGWLVRGATALGATMVLGHLANELYSRGGGIMELAQGKLHKEEPEPDTTILPSELPQSSEAL